MGALVIFVIATRVTQAIVDDVAQEGSSLTVAIGRAKSKG